MGGSGYIYIYAACDLNHKVYEKFRKSREIGSSDFPDTVSHSVVDCRLILFCMLGPSVTVTHVRDVSKGTYCWLMTL